MFFFSFVFSFPLTSFFEASLSLFFASSQDFTTIHSVQLNFLQYSKIKTTDSSSRTSIFPKNIEMGLSSTFLVDVLESENSALYTIKVIKDDQSSLNQRRPEFTDVNA